MKKLLILTILATLDTGTARVYEVMPVAFQAAILALVIFLVIQTRQSEIVPFIYLQY